jgi:hypothetical protein
MCLLIDLTVFTTGEVKRLTKGMISSITPNNNGTAKILLANEDISFDTVEKYDWVISTYNKLKN